MRLPMHPPLDHPDRLPVITGIGCVTPLGATLGETWPRLLRGEDAAGPVTVFDVSGARCKMAAECVLPPWPDLSPKALSRLSRASRLLLPAARDALTQAGLLGARAPSIDGIALSISTTAGAMGWGEDFLRRVLAGARTGLLETIGRQQPQQQILDLQIALGFDAGSVCILGNACASGANALGHAADLLWSGAAEMVLTGGFEALTELVYLGFDCLQASSTDRCRPFDLARSGLLMGEGAAMFVLETASSARRRGVEPLAVLAGYGHSTDGHHLTQPSPDGRALVTAMRRGAERAGLAPADVGYVNAHGTATPMNDGTEVAAYRSFFGDELLPQARVSSTKAVIGHTLGAAGAIEAAFAIQALRTGKLPPQMQTRAPIPEIAASLVPAGLPVVSGLRSTASVNLGFGGSNAALFFRPFSDFT